ncbi:hypothetical protein ILUMI_08651 [Ignelater luminosus]|uniref:Adenosine 5'-monophosphoramidase HINT3 n=1 Tax=Ignelater luminosus TaxID=2038154 RepID=A0A8K0GD73_IGNLU|nr:hypothetical protein ILUMI_08651 [Ignelater luminosus]
MTSDCIFCNICSGAQPTEILYQDDEIAIFNDIKPAAKYHYLAIPKQHIQNVRSLTTDHKPLIEKLINTGKNVLQEKGADINDIRLGFHVPPFNSISHLHLHLISPASDMRLIGRMIFRPDTWWFATPEHIISNLPNPNKL